MTNRLSFTPALTENPAACKTKTPPASFGSGGF
jgi:hypothetical protein